MDDAEIDQFCRVTGCDDRETARFFFESSNGNIGDAIGAYLGAYLSASPCLPIIDRPSAPRDNRPTLTLALSIDRGIDRGRRKRARRSSPCRCRRLAGPFGAGLKRRCFFMENRTSDPHRSVVFINTRLGIVWELIWNCFGIVLSLGINFGSN